MPSCGRAKDPDLATVYFYKAQGEGRLRELQALQSATDFSGWTVLGKPQLELIDRFCRKGWCHGKTNFDEVRWCRFMHNAYVRIATR